MMGRVTKTINWSENPALISLPSCFLSEAWNLHNTYHFVSIEKQTSLVWFDFGKRPSSRLEQLKDSQERMPSLTYTLFPWFGFGLFVCLCVTITIHLAKHHLPPFRRIYSRLFSSVPLFVFSFTGAILFICCF